jgi:hypothetical protein
MMNKKKPTLKLKDMKKLILTPIIALLFASSSVLTAQSWPEEYLGLPGDNLNLYAVMNLFQESETLEGFERSLNDPEKMINNLDLNRDGYVDYILVFDYVEGDIHSIVLRVALNDQEYQDVAVFTVQKFRNGAVQVQLIGDEALYGPNYIIEPVYAETPNPGYRGNISKPRNTTVIRTTYYEVATWPVIVYIYRPSYRVWRSAWYWGYYPTWWSPWTPHYWHFYYGYHYNWHAHYYAYYRPWSHYRCRHYHTHYYTNIRNYSTTVVVNINKGSYRNTYSRPDKRKEGEVLYTQRHSSGSTVGNRSSSAVNTANRQSARALSGSAAARSSEGRKPAATVRNNDSRGAARQSTAPARTERVTRGSNSGNRSTSVDRNSRKRNESSAAPVRNINRPSNDRNTKQSIQNNATRSGEASARSARNERNYSSGSSSSRTQRATPPASNRSNTQSKSVQRSERSGGSRQPASNVRSGSNNRKGSSTSVSKSSGSSSRSGTQAQSSRSSKMTENSRTSGRR